MLVTPAYNITTSHLRHSYVSWYYPLPVQLEIKTMSGVVKGPTSIKPEPGPNPARTETGFKAKTRPAKAPKLGLI